MVMKFLSLRMHARICFLKLSDKLTAMTTAMHYIYLQDSTYNEEMFYHDPMAPSFFQKMRPSFLV